MSDSYIDRIKREGPLPGIDDDSELVGDDDKSADDTSEGAKKEHRGDFITLPARGAGAYPLPLAPDNALNEANVSTGEEAEPDADAGARQEAER
ncbi:MAG: hypothetical protein ACRDV3_11185 [Acidothermaceae bacterium]